jgi:hypothetical protein
MYIYDMWLWKVPKWLWFWSEVAVKAWRELATLTLSCAVYGKANPFVSSYMPVGLGLKLRSSCWFFARSYKVKEETGVFRVLNIFYD